MIRAVFWFVFAACAFAQVPGLSLPPDAVAAAAVPQNLGFETGESGTPVDWYLDQESRVAGYTLEWRNQGCRTGKGCAVMSTHPKPEHRIPGAMMQQFDATPYQGKRIRLRAWVRLEDGRRGDRIRVVLIAEGDKANAEFVQKGGVNSSEWSEALVEGKVPMRAETLHIAIVMTGEGKAWVDDVTLEAVEGKPDE